MPVSRALRRLLRVLHLEEEETRRALESALGDLRRLESLLAAAQTRDRAGRGLVVASAVSGELLDRLAGLEESLAAARRTAALEPRIRDAEQQVAFNANGSLTTVTPNGGAAETVGTAAGDVSGIPLAFNGLADAASNLNMQWNLLGPNGTPTISQVDTASAVSSTTQNGYPSGQYQSFAIGSDGTVTVTYSNGQLQNVGQLALANVENLQGLQLLGDGNYATTLSSGTAAIGASGTAGLATLQDGALEASNVNISSEFSNLIIAQRAFEANAKSVTTFDTVTQDTINMVH